LPGVCDNRSIHATTPLGCSLSRLLSSLKLDTSFSSGGLCWESSRRYEGRARRASNCGARVEVQVLAALVVGEAAGNALARYFDELVDR
jgi:hypothetical protein